MRYGVCIGTDCANVKIAAQSGYDYLETNFGGITRLSDEDFEAFEEAVAESGLKCEAANCFMPNELKPVGPDVNYEGIKEYVEKGMSRGKRIGLETVVFGSGKSRAIPDGWKYADAFSQLAYFLGEIVSPIAEKYGIRVVTEPLRFNESNIINTVKEGVALAAFAGKENIGGLGDLYHMAGCLDTADDIKQLKGSIFHAHISNPDGDGTDKRTFPKSNEEYDYRSFIKALEYAGCERCSIEAGTRDFAADAPLSIKVLREI